MPFQITGVGRKGALLETRMQRSSAVVLAMKWQSLGHTEVAIADFAHILSG